MTTIPKELEERRTASYPDLSYEYREPARGEGWLVFAAFMLGFAGLFGFIDGLVAVTSSSFYVAGAHFVFSGLNTWGWILMAVGAIVVLAAFAIPSRAQWARWTGIFFAGLQAIAQLLMIQAYPFWSLAVFTIDLLVIYALSVHGTRRTDV
jgi:hypothetical protein